jgi:hypothetical protein
VRFNPKANRFDRFVEMPVADLPARSGLRTVKERDFPDAVRGERVRALRPWLWEGDPLPHRREAARPRDANDLTKRIEKVTFIEKDAQEKSARRRHLAAELLRLDVKTGKVTEVHCGISFLAGTAGMARDSKGRLWFNEAFPGRIGRIKP